MPSIIRATGPDGWLTALADGGRLIGGAFYWNSRKSWHRWRGARGRAPCHHPSDSGRAGESSCEACLGLAHARRFAWVCPLLRFDPREGPRCSVAAADVRPFWGRLAAAMAAFGLVAGLGAAALALLAFRTIGYRVQPTDLWPAHWPRLQTARADYYTRRGVAAYSRGDSRGCYLALLEAHHLRPGDYATDRLLAQVAEADDPRLADALFGQLILVPDPLRAANAAQEWAGALLARCRFGQLAGLSAYMLQRGGGDSAPAWANALIFCVQHLPGSTLVADLLARPGALAAAERQALTWSLRPDGAALRAELAAAVRSTSGYLRHYALSRLIHTGHAREALDALAAAPWLPARESESLRLAAWGQLGWTALRRIEVERLLGDGAVSPAVAELLAAELIARPDPAAGQRLLAAVARHPLPLTAENYRIYAALLCVAGVDQDAAQLAALTATLARISGRPFGRPAGVAEIFLDPARRREISSVLIALRPLSLEVMFALLTDYPRLPRAAPQQP